MKLCWNYVNLSIISLNPKENLIYLNNSDCSLDEMQSRINIMRILMILNLFCPKILKTRNKILHATDMLLFSSERARFADSEALFGFKIEES